MKAPVRKSEHNKVLEIVEEPEEVIEAQAEPTEEDEIPFGGDEVVSPGGVMVSKVVALTSGKSKKGPWTLWAIIDSNGKTHTTFSDNISKAAQKAQAEDQKVVIESEKKEKKGKVSWEIAKFSIAKESAHAG